MYNYENAINNRSKSDLSEDMDQELIQLRDSIKQYRSNKRIISNTRNKALRDARDELKSTGYRMARRYEASGEDLVHPYTAKKKILYFVKKISNISGADGDKALLNIADIETELRQEEDKLNTYIKNTNAIEELSTTDKDKEKNYKEILKLQAQIDTLGKPELTQPLIDELRQLLNTSGREISKLENTRDADINKEEYKKQNDEILKAFALIAETLGVKEAIIGIKEEYTSECIMSLMLIFRSNTLQNLTNKSNKSIRKGADNNPPLFVESKSYYLCCT